VESAEAGIQTQAPFAIGKPIARFLFPNFTIGTEPTQPEAILVHSIFSNAVNLTYNFSQQFSLTLRSSEHVTMRTFMGNATAVNKPVIDLIAIAE
jgi:hypothetical protein